MSKSARTPRKTPKKDWRTAQLTCEGLQAIGAPSALDLVAALFAAQDPDSYGPLFPKAVAETARLVRDGFEDNAVYGAIIGMAESTEPDAPQAFAIMDALASSRAVPSKTRDAVGQTRWMIADAGFVLGLVFGMRLGGAR